MNLEKPIATSGVGEYKEAAHLSLYVTGQLHETNWKVKPVASDIYYIKGVAEAILSALGFKNISFVNAASNELQTALNC